MAPKHSLTQLMSERGLNVSSLAAKSGISEPTVRRALNGDEKARPNTTSVTAIAKALDLPVGEINWRGNVANGGRTAGSKSGNTRKPT